MTESAAKQKLTALCAQAEHCSYEMEEKMRRWEMDEKAIASVMEYLTKNEFVDDERYARALAFDKIRYNKWGRRKVEQSLWTKRIDDSISRKVLDAIDDEEYLQVLRPLLKSKRTSVSAGSDYELNFKLVRFALGRGFSMEQIRQCIDEADDMDVEDEPEDISL